MGFIYVGVLLLFCIFLSGILALVSVMIAFFDGDFLFTSVCDFITFLKLGGTIFFRDFGETDFSWLILSLNNC